MRHLLAVVLLFVLFPGSGLAQERWLQGMVFTPGEHDEKLPAVGVTVTAQEFGNAVTTTAEGRFRLTLPTAFQAGDIVTLQVEKPGWRIYLPPEGKTRLPADLRKEAVEVLLLPVDSKNFYTHARLVIFINNLSEKSTQQLTPDNKPVDFSRAIKDWAVKYGFSAEQAKAEIDRWIAEVQAIRNDPFTLGLAAFAEKNFRKASALFHEAATQDERKLVELKQAEAALVDNIVRAFRREGDAHANSYLFDEALAAYQQALRHVTKTQQPRLWAAVLHDVAKAHYERGLRAAGPAIHTHLAEAVAAFRLALEVYTHTDLPQQWATTHNNLGNVLLRQGERTAGEPGTQLLAEAVAAYRLALQVRTSADLPQDWAMTHNNLGLALQAQGERTAGEEGARLLAEAVAAYRLALQVHTRTDLPQQWAMTHNNLGLALQAQGEHTAGEDGARLLAEAVTAYRLALQVHTRTDLPQQWAMTHTNLGFALQAQGERTTGEPSTQLLAEAVAAYHLALQVHTRTDLPQQWAMTHNNLGLALLRQGERTAGEDSVRLLAEAVAAYRLALQVYTRTDLPQQWAMTHNNLGLALQAQGERTAGEDGARLLAEAVAAYRLALEVYTRTDLPQQWAMTHTNLGNALQAQGERTAGEPSTQLLAEAVAAYRLALEVYSPADHSQQWAVVQNNLVRAYRTLYWRQAVTSSMHVLSVDPNAEKAYQTASFLSHNVLFDFAQAFALNQQWLDRHPDDLAARSDFAEKHLTTGRFADSTERLATLLAHPDIGPAVQVALRALDIVNLLALHQAAAVPDRLDAMLHIIAVQANDFRVTWTFSGTRHFIAQHAPLAPYGVWLQQLISALSATDRQAMLTAVQAARASFVEVGK